MSKMARPWSELSRNFSFETTDGDYNKALKALSELCLWIDGNGYDWGLFGWSSHHTLCITQTEPTYPLDTTIQRLYIEPTSKARIAFRFQQTSHGEPSYLREIPSEDIILQMCKFLKQIGWVQTIPFPS